MLSTALIAVLFTAAPAQAVQKPHQIAPIDSACNVQSVDPSFVRMVEKTPSEKAFPGLRLVSDSVSAKPFVTADASRCVTYLTQLKLRR